MADKQPVMMQATQAFSCSLGRDGRVPFAVGAGDIFPASDEVVRKYPANFRALTVRDSSVVRRPLPAYPGAETATAAPGERRSLDRPSTPPPDRATPPVPAPTGSEV